MKSIIFLCGIYAAGFAVFHMFFWKIFRWKTTLQKLHVINRAVVQILNCRLIYFFLFVAFICFAFPVELLTTALGKAFLGGNSLFCAGRTVEQFIFLRVNNRYVHLLTVLFVLGTLLFAVPLF